MTRLLIGCGTGRCGTMSLSRLLSSQPDTRVTHERWPRLPWRYDSAAVLGLMYKLLAEPYARTGDVGFYWLPYLKDVLTGIQNVAVVCLKRDRQATIESYVTRLATYNANHWVVHDGKHWKHNEWDTHYPKYPMTGTDVKAYIGRYWDEYYTRMDNLSKQFPKRIRIWPTEALNTDVGVGQILDFCGVPIEQQRVQIGVHMENHR